MLEIVTESLSGEQYDADYLHPGAVAALGIDDATANSLVLARCFGSDTGGEIRTIDRDVFESLPHDVELSADIFVLTDLIHAIHIGGELKLKMHTNTETPVFIIARHIPVLWN